MFPSLFRINQSPYRGSQSWTRWPRPSASLPDLISAFSYSLSALQPCRASGNSLNTLGMFSPQSWLFWPPMPGILLPPGSYSAHPLIFKSLVTIILSVRLSLTALLETANQNPQLRLHHLPSPSLVLPISLSPWIFAMSNCYSTWCDLRFWLSLEPSDFWTVTLYDMLPVLLVILLISYLLYY